MERKNSRSVFLKKNMSFMERMYFRMLAVYPGVFPETTFGFRFALLTPAGQRSRTKHVLWIPFCNIASGGSKISTKTRPGNKNMHI